VVKWWLAELARVLQKAAALPMLIGLTFDWSYLPNPEVEPRPQMSYFFGGQMVACRACQGATGSSCTAYAAWFDCGGKVSDVSIFRPNLLLEVTVKNVEQRLQSQYWLVLQFIGSTMGDL
jgi:hypothetical protein